MIRVNMQNMYTVFLWRRMGNKVSKVNKTFINKYAPIFRHWFARKTENHQESNRSYLERPFSSFMILIDVNWNQLGPCRSSLGIGFINTVHLRVQSRLRCYHPDANDFINAILPKVGIVFACLHDRSCGNPSEAISINVFCVFKYKRSIKWTINSDSALFIGALILLWKVRSIVS